MVPTSVQAPASRGGENLDNFCQFVPRDVSISERSLGSRKNGSALDNPIPGNSLGK